MFRYLLSLDVKAMTFRCYKFAQWVEVRLIIAERIQTKLNKDSDCTKKYMEP